MKQLKLNKIVFSVISLSLILLVAQNCLRQPQIDEKPKYVFLFIGDGMGFSHIAAAEAYLSATIADEIGNMSLSFSDFPILGMATTYSADSFVTCSSAAGTALSTGSKTNNDMVAVTPDGEKLKSITYYLQEAGFKIGIATTVSLEHATPASFYASDKNRRNHYHIACQLPLSGFDFFAGSGFLDPKGKSGSEKDILDIIRETEYAVVKTQNDLNRTSLSQKIVMLQEDRFDNEALVKAIERSGDDGWTLSQFTQIGIERLFNQAGFFFMVEGGQIDWGGHDNDAAFMIYETIDFSQAVNIALEFYRKYPAETLIVVTADHETGGISLGNTKVQYALYPELLEAQANMNMSRDEIIELNKTSGFGWTSDVHTGGAVPIFAIGAGSDLFRGKMDNTDIPKKIQKLMIKDK